MPVRIGVDFGTTYTVVSRIENGEPKVIEFGNDYGVRNAVESVVAITPGGKVLIGKEAAEACEKGVKIFKGFKMLLESPRETWPAEYSEEYTPERIMNIFFEELFRKVKRIDMTIDSFESVTVGIPNVWTKNGNDTRKRKVFEAVKKAAGAKTVCFCEEPKLAAAAIINAINKKRRIRNKDPFTGYIFVIDYGGGTLDLSLCRAETDKDTGKTVLTIVGPGWGRGENTEGKIGDAGLSYMESLADILLKDNGFDSVEKNAEYHRFVKDVENAVIKCKPALEGIVGKKEKYLRPSNPEYNAELPEIYYANFRRKGCYFKVRELWESYGRIEQALRATLKEAEQYMIDNGIDFRDTTKGTFKIAMVGGFCNYLMNEYLIKQTDLWCRGMGAFDARYNEFEEFGTDKMRLTAVADGATLEVNDIIKIEKQFPYSLFVYPNSREDKPKPLFLRYDVYRAGEPVFFGNRDMNGRIVPISVGGKSIPWISRGIGGADEMKTEPKKPAETMDLYGQYHGTKYLAVAMEEDGRLTLYLYSDEKYDRLTAEEKADRNNSALLGKTGLPDIDTLYAFGQTDTASDDQRRKNDV